MLKHASIVISIILAALYSIGLSFHQGYLRTLGIEETQFQLSIDRLFFQGFFATADLSTGAVVWLVMAASGVVIVANVGVLLIEIVNKLELKKYIPSQLFSKNENNTNHPFFEFSFRVFLYIIVLFGVYLGILLVLIASDNSGTSHAEKFIERTENGDVKMKTVLFKNNADDYTGFSVICNDAQCAYFNHGQSTIINNRDVQMVTSSGN
jgi:hypothetical protein